MTTNQKEAVPRHDLIAFSKIVLTDVYQGFLHLSHSGMALLGIAVAATVITLLVRVEWRTGAEQQLLGWLLKRQEQTVEVLSASDQLMRSTHTKGGDVFTPVSLPKVQAHVAQWLSRKYRVAPEPLSVLVAEAFAVGEKVRLDPTLILAVMAIESRFNPYAQSPVGAQGLMQVLTRVHSDKYEHFGGQMAAFDPVANLRVGVKVLKACVVQAGSVEAGLRCYVGAVSTDGSDYVNKVMAEHLRIQSVALNKPMPTTFPTYPLTPTPESATTEVQAFPPIAPAVDAPTPAPASDTANLVLPEFFLHRS